MFDLGTNSYKDYSITIVQDEDAENPRDMDNLGTMYCKHKDYTLGDKDADPIGATFKGVQLPLYLYDHSGITMNTSGFNCPWDSAQVGYIYISDEKIKKEYNVERISKKLRDRIITYLTSEVKTYDQYLTGDIYGYQIELNDDHIDSCYGFFGLDYITDEIKNSINYDLDQKNKTHQAQVKSYIKNHVPLIHRA